MALVKFTSALNRFFPELRELELSGNTVKQIIEAANSEVPGLKPYLIDDDGSLRKHVNIFIKENLIHDRIKLSDVIEKNDEILIYQALSGG